MSRVIASGSREVVNCIIDQYVAQAREVGEAALINSALETVSRPVAGEPTSFELHAPIELLARIRLLPHLSGRFRDLALLNIFTIGKAFERSLAARPTLDLPVNQSAEDPIWVLQKAIAVGDKSLAAAAVAGLVRRRKDAQDLVASLGRTPFSSTAGAGHISIFLSHLLDLPDANVVSGLQALGGIGAEFVDPDAVQLPQPDPQLGDWGLDNPTLDEKVIVLAEFFANPPAIDFFGTPFISPMVGHVISDGRVARYFPLISELSGNRAGRDRLYRILCRLAALSMLTESSRHAPLGWSHCLTLPAAAWRLSTVGQEHAYPLLAAAVYYVSFRAVLHERYIDPVAATSCGIDCAADVQMPGDIQSAMLWIAAHASIRPDAHLVKYVTTTIWLVGQDPEAASLYMAAAKKLVSIWLSMVPTDSATEYLTLERF